MYTGPISTRPAALYPVAKKLLPDQTIFCKQELFWWYLSWYKSRVHFWTDFLHVWSPNKTMNVSLASSVKSTSDPLKKIYILGLIQYKLSVKCCLPSNKSGCLFWFGFCWSQIHNNHFFCQHPMFVVCISVIMNKCKVLIKLMFASDAMRIFIFRMANEESAIHISPLKCQFLFSVDERLLITPVVAINALSIRRIFVIQLWQAEIGLTKPFEKGKCSCQNIYILNTNLPDIEIFVSFSTPEILLVLITFTVVWDLKRKYTSETVSPEIPVGESCWSGGINIIKKWIETVWRFFSV